MTECEQCQASGLVDGTRCHWCDGSGYLPIGDMSWDEDGALSTVGDVMVGRVPPPANRPLAVVTDNHGFTLGKSYSFELEWDGHVLSYTGVQVEESDISPGMMVVRLDRAMTIAARKI